MSHWLWVKFFVSLLNRHDWLFVMTQTFFTISYLDFQKHCSLFAGWKVHFWSGNNDSHRNVTYEAEWAEFFALRTFLHCRISWLSRVKIRLLGGCKTVRPYSNLCVLLDWRLNETETVTSVPRITFPSKYQSDSTHSYRLLLSSPDTWW